MGCPPDHAVQVGLLDVEVHIQAVQHLQVICLAQDVVNHLDVGASVLRVVGCISTNLDSGRVERSVLVLVRRHQDRMLEPLRALLHAQAVKRRVLNVI